MVSKEIRAQACISVYPRHKHYMQANKGLISEIIRNFIDSLIMQEGYANEEELIDYQSKKETLEKEIKEKMIELQTVKRQQEAQKEAAKKIKEKIKLKQSELNKKNIDKTRKLVRGMKESGELRNLS